MIHQGKARYPVREAILHTSATPGGWEDGKSDQEIYDQFWNWHVEGHPHRWRKIGYHRIIRTDGTVLWDTKYLRSITEIGAHVKERNRGTIGICLIPARTVPNVLRRNAVFMDYYTGAQAQALKGYLKELGEITDLKWVTGHNDYAPKACPGFNVQGRNWLP
ncbi:MULTISPECIES: N-acetylmuramoyl-L-alanine amidase [unclassified Mameliella]|uniref:N-acetylmuramoyl-L-alanine amidase n=1 Tax=Mameliella sp. LZ-28 TaxID=2484146 RepID=UPI00143FA7DF|nr:N-acetylmuramoyl-L-alanine amidase [Mameliella sp. LZ-28]MCR9274406.1 N-acetylmuramoyl-L-alanine amidase [Paracoccaceae bacterium]